MTIIECLGRDGIFRNFRYTYEIENDEGMYIWKFRVIPNHDNFNDFFYFSAKEIVGNTLKVTMINHNNNNEYSAKGIPEIILQELRALSGKVIISSSNKLSYQSFDEEYRTCSASKVWNRLVERGIASYDNETDTYKLE